MRNYIAIVIPLLLCGCRERQTQQTVSSQYPYEFHYVGKETTMPHDNDIVIYRFNRATGEAERIVYHSMGVPGLQGPSVDRVNLLTAAREFRLEQAVDLTPTGSAGSSQPNDTKRQEPNRR